MPDEKAFIALLSEHQNIVHKVCRLYQPAASDRTDLFQEVVLAAWKGFHSFKGDAKFSTWLYRVALNTAISFYRKEKRRPAPAHFAEDMLNIPAADDSGGEAEQRDALYKCINDLSAIDKALVMLYIEDYNHADIAGMLGITANHVAVKLTRIKSKLKEATKKYLST